MTRWHRAGRHAGSWLKGAGLSALVVERFHFFFLPRGNYCFHPGSLSVSACSQVIRLSGGALVMLFLLVSKLFYFLLSRGSIIASILSHCLCPLVRRSFAFLIVLYMLLLLLLSCIERLVSETLLFLLRRSNCLHPDSLSVAACC